jgi:Neocarzinostatin family
VDATGSVSGFVTVERMLQSLDGTGTVDCSAAPGACAISAFDLASTVVDALITFGDPSVPQPALSVSPAADLADGDVVTVTGTSFPAGASVTVAQCVTNRTRDYRLVRRPATRHGVGRRSWRLRRRVTGHRRITISSGSVIDCAGQVTLLDLTTDFVSGACVGQESPAPQTPTAVPPRAAQSGRSATPVVHQAWPIDGGTIIFEIRSERPLPASAYATVGEVVASLERLSVTLAPATSSTVADESEPTE